MVEVRLQQSIAAPAERVFDWLADPRNLAAAPLVLKAGYATGSPASGVGAVRAVLGAGMWFREEFTGYDRPRSYSYRIVRSFPPFDHDGGTLTFAPAGSGTQVTWSTSYTHPLYAGGRALQAISRPLLTSSIRAILAACATELER